MVRPRGSCEWSGFVRRHGTFFVLTAVTAGTLLNLGLFAGPRWRDAYGWATVAGAATLVWWWYCLGRGVLARTERGIGRLVAIALIPLVGIATYFFWCAIAVRCLYWWTEPR